MANQGSLKSYDQNRGFGFITCDGVDYFFHKSDIKGKPPQDGDVLTFDMAPGPAKKRKKMKAKNVTGGTFSAPDPSICHLRCEGGWANSAETIWCCEPCCLPRLHFRGHDCGRKHFVSV
jgi:cold shock CspA family protein